MGIVTLLTSLIFTSLAFSSGFSPKFNRVSHETYVDPYRGHLRIGQNIEQQAIELIQNARRRVWVAAYELRLPNVANALKDAHERGVDVRIVTENENNYDFKDLPALIEDANSYELSRLQEYFAYTDLNNNAVLEEEELLKMDALRILNDAAIPIVDDTEDGSKGSGLMHHKFLVIDSKIVFSGSGNFTWSDHHGDKLKPLTRGNANNFFVIESQILNKAFADEFLILWGDGPNGLKNSKFGVKKPYRAPITTQLQDGSRVTLQFGGTSKTYGWESSPNGLIGRELSQLNESLDAALFVWSEQTLADLIPQHIAAHTRILLDPFFGYRSYSELLDLLGVEMYSDNCKLEKGNKPWSTPAMNSGIAELTSGDRLHHKFAILDSKKVLTGSHNWSLNANHNNDEVVLLIESPRIAAIYKDEFKRLELGATYGLSPRLQRKIQLAKDNCTPH